MQEVGEATVSVQESPPVKGCLSEITFADIHTTVQGMVAVEEESQPLEEPLVRLAQPEGKLR